MGQILTTVAGLVGGVTAVAGVGKRYRVAVTGTWATDEEFTLLLTAALTGSVVQVGAGDVTGESPAFCLTLKRKEYLAGGAKLFFSALDQADMFNNLNGLGNGFLAIANNYAMSEDLQSMAPYQGKLSVFGRSNIQIYVTSADPGSYQQVQVLDNIGTFAPDSVKAQGELDVFFLNDTGVRSLRARDASSNAYPVDIGSPIDSLIQSKILEATSAQLAAACGVIEPTTGQYWLYLKDKLYVLSNYPNAKVVAWATWNCGYQSASGTGVKISNQYPASIEVKIGVTSNIDSIYATTGTLAAGQISAAIAPGRYMFLYVEGVYDNTLPITGGLDFSGTITLDAMIPVYTSYQTAFVPQKFEIHNGQTFVSTSNAFYVYGGADKNTYDNVVAVVETSWLDSDSPANNKQFHGVDVAQSGTWNHFVSTDYLGDTAQAVMLAQTNPTFDGGKIDYSAHGTHVKHRAQTSGVASRCVLSNLLIHYKQIGQK